MAEGIKNVFILGAGFSAPAKLPVQDRILNEMLKKPAASILSYTPEEESTKFLKSYIAVGMFLLDNYSSYDCSHYKKEYSDIIIKAKYANQIDCSVYSLETNKNELIVLRERIRESLAASNIQVCLEDVFTSFDKMYQGRVFFHNYSVQYADEIKESITRLFIYYFSKCCNDYDYDSSDYIHFFDYLKKNSSNSSVISTNWDVLAEGYLDIQGMKYDLSLNNEYFLEPSKKKAHPSSDIQLVKIHGSINWFKCLNCGKITIVDRHACGNYLFDDSSLETCVACKEKRETDYLLEPQIITPTMMKSLNNQLYSNLWSSARDVLRNANQVYFIGYSLPIADYDFRFMLHQSISTEAKIYVILYHNDDPSQTDKSNLKQLLPEKRYRDLFARNEIEFSYDGFGEYFKDK